MGVPNGFVSIALAGKGTAKFTFLNAGAAGTVTVSKLTVVNGVTTATTVLGTALSTSGDVSVLFSYDDNTVLSISEDTGRIGMRQGALQCGADPCVAVDNAAVNTFADLTLSPWVTSDV